MKKLRNTSYYQNKFSNDIVYFSVTGNLSITKEAFLKSNPALSEEDYEFFKSWSDENYRLEERMDTNEAKRILSVEHIEALSESYMQADESEDEPEADFERSLPNAYAILEASGLTPTQKRRYLLHYMKGLTMREIAALEKVGHTKIAKSIAQAERKIHCSVHKK